jgi:hypothetical protein
MGLRLEEFKGSMVGSSVAESNAIPLWVSPYRTLPIDPFPDLA